MTLIITTVSPAAVTMVGDRRLTISGGRVYREDAVKQGCLLTPDACTLYGYTGIAEVGNFKLQRWIGEAILDLTKEEELPFDELMHHLAEQATGLFETHPTLKRIDKDQRHTTVIFSGFMVNADPVTAIVSNFEDEHGVCRTVWERFKATLWRARTREASASATFLSGNIRGLKLERWSELNDLLLQEKTLAALIGKSEHLLHEAAISPQSANTIGKSRMVAHLKAPTSNIPPTPSSRFVNDINSSTIYTLDMINTCTDARTFIADFQLSADNNEPLLYAVRQRNAPCSCGSGVKYKFCHGI